MMPAPWKGTGGGPLLSGMVRGPPGRSLRGNCRAHPIAGAYAVCLACWSHLNPRGFKTNTCSFLATLFWQPDHRLSQAEASELFPPRPAWAGDASCIFISTWNRGPRAAHAHYSPSQSPSPRQWLGKHLSGLQGGVGGPVKRWPLDLWWRCCEETLVFHPTTTNSPPKPLSICFQEILQDRNLLWLTDSPTPILFRGFTFLHNFQFSLPEARIFPDRQKKKILRS